MYLGALDTALKYYGSIFLMFFNQGKRPANKEARDFDRRIAFLEVFLMLTDSCGVVRHYAASLASRANKVIVSVV